MLIEFHTYPSKKNKVTGNSLSRLNFSFDYFPGSRYCAIPIAKRNVHHQFGVKFGNQYIEEMNNRKDLKSEKYPIKKYEIPTDFLIMQDDE